MLITARRKLSFNLGKYENMETEVILTDIPEGTDPLDISGKLDEIMQPDIIRASLATSHAEDDNVTSVYEWKKITEGAYDA